MRKPIASLALSILIAIITFGVSPMSAQAATSKIYLFDAPHVDLLNLPLDNKLIPSLMPEGRLGQMVYTPSDKPRTWFVDAALIDEVTALALKDPVAQNWLTQLKKVSVDDLMVAIPYGHPELSLIRHLAPSELTFYYESSQTSLQNTFAREVLIERGARWENKSTLIIADVVHAYSANRRALALLATVVPAQQLESLRSKLAFLLSSGSTVDSQKYFAQNADLAIAAANHKLRIVPGKYRLTSQHEKVPITLVNDYAAPVRVTLELTPLNSRIKAGRPETVSLEANSKTQLSIPFTVIAPGSSAVLAEFRNSAGRPLGDSVILALSVSVISPTVAWFTVGAAILLFIAAITQSVRRVRRSRR